MKRIVDIPEEMYDWLDNGFPDEDDYTKLWEKIKQGTPLQVEFEGDGYSDGKGASAELQIRNNKGNVKPIMKDTSGVWGF